MINDFNENGEKIKSDCLENAIFNRELDLKTLLPVQERISWPIASPSKRLGRQNKVKS